MTVLPVDSRGESSHRSPAAGYVFARRHAGMLAHRPKRSCSKLPPTPPRGPVATVLYLGHHTPRDRDIDLSAGCGFRGENLTMDVAAALQPRSCTTGPRGQRKGNFSRKRPSRPVRHSRLRPAAGRSRGLTSGDPGCTLDENLAWPVPDGPARDLVLMADSSTDNPSVPEQVRRAAEGDRQAWADLLNAHRPRLRRMVALRLHRRLQGRLDPSDVIQEAYLDATAGLAEYAARAEMPFFLWLRWLTGMRLTTLHRKHLGCQVRDAARRCRSNTARCRRRPPPSWRPSSWAATPAPAWRRSAERQRRLQEALNAMDPVDREVLVLRHFEELTNAEVARELGLQESAASKRYIRALRKLKEILAALPGGIEEFR